MALVYLFDARPDAYVAVDWDIGNDEVTEVVFANTGTDNYEVTYTWRNGQDRTHDLDAGTPETRIGIPPGQRKWLVRTTGPKAGGYDCEFATIRVLRKPRP